LKNYRRLRKELKSATWKTEKEYHENICDEIGEFQRKGRFDLRYIKKRS
jgi:hypothetical protein